MILCRIQTWVSEGGSDRCGRCGGHRRSLLPEGRLAGILCLLVLVPIALSEPPALDGRLDADQFREGLRKRGLIELLEYQLRIAPPDNPVDADLMRRQLLLAAREDAGRSPGKRQEAVAEGNDILRRLIAAGTDDPRSLQWRLDLGRSLLYVEAEQLCVSVLYRGSNAKEKERLFELTTEAIGTFDALLALLEVEYDRLDSMGLAEYERLEQKGYIQNVERMEPQARYMRRWAAFYRAITFPAGDGREVNELRLIATELREDTDLLETDHEFSHLQAQSLLLAGLANRRTGDYSTAVVQLEQVLGILERLSDNAEVQSLQWAASLAHVERVRALRDSRQFVEALTALDDTRSWLAGNAPDNPGLKLVLAFLERSIAQARLKRSKASGDSAAQKRLESEAVAPLIMLARQDESLRQAIYTDLYDTLSPNVKLESLHPFERCAIIAGILSATYGDDSDTKQPDDEPGQGLEVRKRALLERAVAAAQINLDLGGSLEDDLRAESFFNLGVARYQLRNRLDASWAFFEVAQQFPHFRRAESAANWAVKTASELYQNISLRGRGDVQTMYLKSLRLLTEQFPESQGGKYWRFFLAQTLEELNRFDEATQVYGLVTSDHEHYTAARFSQCRCQSKYVVQLAEATDAASADLQQAAHVNSRLVNRFATDAGRGKLPAYEGNTIDGLLAKTILMKAEVLVLPKIDRYNQALEALDGFEEAHPAASDLVGRVLRVRIIAYQGLGWLDEAEREIPRYIASDPARAGATLQSLFDAGMDEIQRLRETGRESEARSKARAALLLAEQIEAWATAPSAQIGAPERVELNLQLAEVSLAAGKADQARELFRALKRRRSLPADSSARATLGLAEAQFALGEFEASLSGFNELFKQLEKNTPSWWRALLGDLKSRTALEHDPGELIKVIEQHRYLYRSNLGGAHLEAQFQVLLDQNRDRLANSRPSGRR